MKKTAFTFFISCTLCCSVVVQTIAQTQTWDWARSGIGADAENINCVTTDVLGNVYVAGYYYSSTLTVGTFSLKNTGNYDLFVTKFDPLGNILWARSGGGIYDEVGLGIAVDINQNVFVTGYSYSPIITLGSFSLSGAGSGDAFVVKYNFLGTEIWAKNIGGANDENASAISCDPSGNIIITGYFQSSNLIIGSDTLINSGADDVFISKINAAGNFLWSKSANGPGSEKGNSLISDPDGNVLLTGVFDGPSVNIGSDSLFNSGSSDAFVFKFNAAGTLQWKKGCGGIYNDFGNSITTDPAGNVFIIGTYNSPSLTIAPITLTNSGGFDFFVIKYDALGNLIWTKTQGGIFDDTGYGITCNYLGDVFLTGHFHSPSLILGADTLNNEGIGDLYVTGYTGAGNLLWSKQLGGTSDDGSGSIAADKTGNLFVGGYFISPSLVCPEFTLTNSGKEDLLLVKLNVEYDFTSLVQAPKRDLKQIFPNPGTGLFQVIAESNTISLIEVYDSVGKKMRYITNTQNLNFIDLKGEPAGIYLICMTSGQKVEFKKVILR